VGAMGVLVVDRGARAALFAHVPNAKYLIHLAEDNPSGCSTGLEMAAAAAAASDAERPAAVAALAPLTRASTALQTAAAEALLAALYRDARARAAFAAPGVHGLASLTALLESRVLRVQYAASAAVALYSSSNAGRDHILFTPSCTALHDILRRGEHYLLGMAPCVIWYSLMWRMLFTRPWKAAWPPWRTQGTPAGCSPRWCSPWRTRSCTRTS